MVFKHARTICSAFVLGLVLSACGGEGGDLITGNISGQVFYT